MFSFAVKHPHKIMCTRVMHAHDHSAIEREMGKMALISSNLIITNRLQTLVIYFLTSGVFDNGTLRAGSQQPYGRQMTSQ